MTRRTELPELTAAQMGVLLRFARFEASLDELRRSLAGVFEIEFSPGRRTANSSFRVPEPGIMVTRDLISRALERKRRGLISEEELALWATILLLNFAYVPDPKDEDFVAEWLNDISYNLGAT